MTVKEKLHKLIDEMPESELAEVERILEDLRNRSARLPRILEEAPYDDEPETEEEHAAVQKAKQDIAAGRVVSHQELRRRLLKKRA